MSSLKDGLLAEAKDLEQKDRRIVRASDLLKRGVHEIPMLFAPVFPRKGVALFAGSSDAGKSMLLRNMAIAVTTGRDFLGWKFKGAHRSCIFVATEDDEDATSYLLSRHEKTYGDAVDALHNLRFMFNSENVIAELNTELAIEPADLVIVDAYSDVFDGKEQNNAAQTRAFVNKFKVLAEQHECLFLFLHHTGKRTEDLAPSKNNFVGSQSLEASVRLGIELRVDRANPELRHFCIVKGNYLGSEYKRASFVLCMDENFVFSETGDRMAFESLALNTKPPKKDVPKTPEDFDEVSHHGFLSGLSNTPLSKNQMNPLIRNFFDIGDHAAREFIEYYIEKGWIKDVSGGKFPMKFQSTVGQLPF